MINYDIEIRSSIYDGLAEYEAYLFKNGLKNKKEIHVAVASMGGSLNDALSIYQLFKDHGNVIVHYVGPVASAATVLALGAKKVIMSKGALMLIHNASFWIELWSQMNKEDIADCIEKLQGHSENLATFDKTIVRLMAEKSNQTEENIAELMTQEKWLDPQTAKEIGLIDEIDDEPAQEINNSVKNEALLNHFPEPEQIIASSSNPILAKFKKFFQPSNKISMTFENKYGAINAAINSVAGIPVNDKGEVTLTAVQAEAMNTSFVEMAKASKDALESLASNEAKITALNEQVKVLQNSTEPDNRIVGTGTTEVADDEYSLVQNTKEMLIRAKFLNPKK